jgi:hypothetical protein
MMWTVASVLHFFASSPCIRSVDRSVFERRQPVFRRQLCAVISQPSRLNEESRVMVWWSSTRRNGTNNAAAPTAADLGHVPAPRGMTGQRRQNARAVSSMKGASGGGHPAVR